MRSQNIKYNSSGKIGGASCLLLLFLTSLTLNPLSASSVFAEEIPENVDANANTDIITTASALTDSTVTIGFSPSAASGSVTPIDTNIGDATKVDIQATVRVQNSGGYSVYIGSTSSQLKNGNNAIDSVTSTTTYANMPVNRWGYSFRKATSSTDKAVTDSYVAMPATVRSVPLDSNTSTNIKDETRYYMLSFAARIGSDKPSGTYTNSVTMSVVSNPLEVTTTLNDITTMQEMTSDICANTASGATKQLKDTRDNKMYWVKKVSNGKCWMVQNLDLDLGTSWPDANKSDYTIANVTYKPIKTETTVASSSFDNSYTEAAYTATRSWSLGDYVIINPSANSNCGDSGKSSFADCPTQFVSVVGKTASTDPDFYTKNEATVSGNEYDSHYLVGNYYQWNTATAGTGGLMESGEATGSICPKGWRLPTSGTFNTIKAQTTLANFVGNEYFGVRAGRVGTELKNAGYEGYLWSSTAHNGTYGGQNGKYFFAQRLWFYASSGLTYYYGDRLIGYSVRCIAH